MSLIEIQPQRRTLSPETRAKMAEAWRRGRAPGGNGAGKFDRLTDEQRADIVARYADGQSTWAISRDYGVSNVSIANWLVRMGVTLRKPRRPPRLKFTASVLVPKWVPKPLRAGFRKIAIASDEIEAATWAREQKRKMEQSFARGAANGRGR